MTNRKTEETLKLLTEGKLRAAKKIDGKWVVDIEVKKSILECFKAGVLKEFSDHHYHGFVDKDNLPPQKFTPERKIRLIPGGSSVRYGSHIASGVIIMPPAYVNIGAYIDEGSMVDSHVLVGSCAQIGKNVHLSAGVQIGGVLEPIGNAPVVIEDNAFIGAGSIIVEGVQILKNAIIAPGVTLSKSIPVYDCVKERLLNKEEPIPENAVVIPGTRPLRKDLRWGSSLKLNLNCGIIIKYRDSNTDTSIELENVLR